MRAFVFVFLILIAGFANAARVSSAWFTIAEVHVTEKGWISIIPKVTEPAISPLDPICNYPRMKEGSAGQTEIGVNRSYSAIMGAMYSAREIRVDYDNENYSCWIYKVYIR
jgi:hypothetical protein